MMNLNSCQDCPGLEFVRRETGRDFDQITSVQANDHILSIDGWKTTESSSDALDGFIKQHVSRSGITLIFAKADKVRECPRCRQIFKQVLKMPEFWWSRGCKHSPGYFGCEDTVDEHGNFDGQNTWFRFLVKQTLQNVPEGQKDYLWYKFSVFTRWISNTNQSILVVFDPRPAVQARLPSPLLDSVNAADFSNPYWIHALFLEEVVRLQDEAVWGIRNLVRETETQRSPSSAPNPNYPRLHDIARHAIHVSETLELAAKTIESMIEHYDEFITERPTQDEKTTNARRKIRNHMQFYHSLVGSLRSRSTSNKQRLLNEIQLAFNTVAQYDSRISVDIAHAAHIDSAAMKTVSFLTLTFFPATFISSIFSMSFFNFDSSTDSWTVSREFWVYWAVAIPVTAITATLWFFWNKLFPPKRIGEKEFQPRGAHSAKREMKELATKLRGYDADVNGVGKV